MCSGIPQSAMDEAWCLTLPHPKLSILSCTKVYKKGGSWPVSFEQEGSHRSLWKERAKGGTKSLGNHQSQNTYPNSCPQSEHPYCNKPCSTASSKSLAHLILSRILGGREEM